MTHIGDEAFDWCTSLTGITLPDNVTNIGDSAFSYCKSLTGITLPGGLTNIGKGAFAFDDELTVRCREHSYAHGYAKENNVKYELTE